MNMDCHSDSRQAGIDNSFSSFLLVVSAQSTSIVDGRWRFNIETADGRPVLDAEDDEPGDLNRLTLLAAVRGMEAMDGPSSVTLLSHNRYLIRSLTDSLPRWRRSDFVWDHFGRRVEVQHADLWRRIDHTLHIHDVQACLLTARRVSPKTQKDQLIRADHAHSGPPAPKSRRRGTRPTQPITDPAASPSNDRLRDWLLTSAIAQSPTRLPVST